MAAATRPPADSRRRHVPAWALQAVALLVVPVALGAVVGWYGLNPDAAEAFSPVGSEAHALLSGFPDAVLVVEIDYQQSIGPPPASAVGVLEDRINATCQKGSVEVEEHGFASSSTGFRESDLLALEQSVRHHAPSPGTVVLDYLYLDGGDLDHPSTLGLAYRGASIAVFGATIDSAASLGEQSAVTTTVLVHEFGHELGLVGLVGSAANEDPAHPGHSSDPNDVMYWSVDTTALLGGLFGGAGPPNQFDAADLNDLATVKTTPIWEELLPWAVLGSSLLAAGAIILRHRRHAGGRRDAPSGGP